MSKTWVASVIDAMHVPGMPRVFALGCFERRVTVYSQQIRALNLADALFLSGVLRPGDDIAVVGAGVAGLTFACAAAHLGANVTVLEKEGECLPLFRYTPNRWLHPRVYDWPLPGWNHDRSDLPIMDWTAGTVADVRAQFIEAWKRACEAYGSRLRQIFQVFDIAPGSSDDRGIWLSWNAAEDDDRGPRPFALAVFAVGFGTETEDIVGHRTYWEPDDLDGDPAFRLGVDMPKTFLVSGCGDGALTDLLRLCIREFRHDRLLQEFLPLDTSGEIIDRIRQIEEDPRVHAPSARSFLYEKYRDIKIPSVIQELKARRRQDTDVTLNSLEDFFIQLNSSALNRFLVMQLWHAGGFKFLPGRIVKPVSVDGTKLRVQIENRPVRTFDRVVVRHGPLPALSHFEGVWKAFSSFRSTWREAPHLLDQTRERFWDIGTFGEEKRGPLEPQGANLLQAWQSKASRTNPRLHERIRSLQERLTGRNPEELVSDILAGRWGDKELAALSEASDLGKSVLLPFVQSRGLGDSWERMVFADLCSRSETPVNTILNIALDPQHTWGTRIAVLSSLRFADDLARSEANKRLGENAKIEDIDNTRLSIIGHGYLGNWGVLDAIGRRENVTTDSYAADKLCHSLALGFLDCYAYHKDRQLMQLPLNRMSLMLTTMEHQGGKLHPRDVSRKLQVIRLGLLPDILKHLRMHPDEGMLEGVLYTLDRRVNPFVASDLNQIARDQNLTLSARRSALKALASIPNEEAFNLSDECAKDKLPASYSMRVLAIGTNRSHRHADVILTDQLNDPHSNVEIDELHHQVFTVWTAGELSQDNPDRFLPLLKLATTQVNSLVRAYAWLGIAKSGQPVSVEDLRSATECSSDPIERLILAIAGLMVGNAAFFEEAIRSLQVTGWTIRELQGHLFRDFRAAVGRSLGEPGKLLLHLLDRGDVY